MHNLYLQESDIHLVYSISIMLYITIIQLFSCLIHGNFYRQKAFINTEIFKSYDVVTPQCLLEYVTVRRMIQSTKKSMYL